MAHQTERAEVIQVAFPSPFGDGPDVVSVPERAAGGGAAQPPHRQSFGAGCAAAALERCIGSDSIQTAESTDTSIAMEDLIAQVSRVGAQAPLMHAEVGAEGPAARSEDLELAPATERASV